ncbi:hypothetical protein PDE_03601 [Penicillium oxalicum 114-2]|uniref:Uncharacterized protein n=1 Tax=Penicillium oxalicum (strain 114-2 / CGMCC 5302) TaxID=933388 RepID=S7ZDC5_PENO1|nr:hypothetical protein PDE_03601 [Penicillium oxalicum 114-2]
MDQTTDPLVSCWGDENENGNIKRTNKAKVGSVAVVVTISTMKEPPFNTSTTQDHNHIDTRGIPLHAVYAT